MSSIVKSHRAGLVHDPNQTPDQHLIKTKKFINFFQSAVKKKEETGILVTPPGEMENIIRTIIDQKVKVHDVAKVKLLVRNMMNNRSVRKLKHQGKIN